MPRPAALPPPEPSRADSGPPARAAVGLAGLAARIRKRFEGREFLSAVALLAGGTAAGQLIVILASPFLTRLYTPEEIGLFGLFTGFTAVATVALTLRYETAIPAPRKEATADRLMALSLLLVLPVAVVASLGLHGLIRYDLLGFGALPWYTPFVAFAALVLLGAYGVVRYALLRESRFQPLAQVSLVQNGTRAGSQILLGALSFSLPGLLVGEVLGRAAGLGRMVRATWPRLKRAVRRVKGPRLRETAWEHRKYPLFALPSSLVDNLAVYLPIPLIATSYGVAAAGFFALTQRVLSLPLALVGASVADAFHSRAARYAREEPHRVEEFFFRVAGGLLLVGALPALALALFGEPLFTLAFGASWATAGTLATVMAPWVLAILVVSPLSRIVLVLQGQELKLAYDVLALLVNGTVLVLSHAAGFSLVEAVTLLSVANVAVYGVYFLILWRTVKRGGSRE